MRVEGLDHFTILTTGTIDHAALRICGYREMKKRLDDNAGKYMETQVPGRQITQVFVETPEGAAVELNFQADDVIQPA